MNAAIHPQLLGGRAKSAPAAINPLEWSAFIWSHLNGRGIQLSYRRMLSSLLLNPSALDSCVVTPAVKTVKRVLRAEGRRRQSGGRSRREQLLLQVSASREPENCAKLALRSRFTFLLGRG